jgi:hypothetical protein
MAEFPVLFKISDVKSFLSANKSVDRNLKFLYAQLSTYKEIYSHNSDADIDAYVKKHKLKFLVYKGTIFGPEIDSIVDLIDYNFSDFHHLSSRYKNFQYQILLLIQFVEKEISDLLFLKTFFDDDFKICFDKDELFKIMDSFGDDDCSALDWIDDENEKILSVINHYSLPLFEKIQSKYNVAGNGHSLYNKIPIYRSAVHQSFLEKLQNVLLPSIEYFINELDFKVTLEMALFNYDLLKEDDSEKFPLFNYDFNYINSFCDSVFRSVEEKTEYISYALLEINTSLSPDDSSAGYFKSFISPFKRKLAHLKTVCQMNHYKEIPPPQNINIDTSCIVDGFKQAIEPLANLHTETPPPLNINIDTSCIVDEIKQAIEPLSNHNSINSISKIIPKRKQDSILIKRYIAIAIEAEGVPMLKQLASEEFSISFWSKKFLDIYFITKLLKEIESKIKNENVHSSSRSLYLLLLDDINSRIPKATESERSKTGVTNKNSPSSSITPQSFPRALGGNLINNPPPSIIPATSSKPVIDIFDGDDSFS